MRDVIQALRGQIPPFQLLTMRFIGQSVILILVFLWKKEWPKVTNTDAMYLAGWIALNLVLNLCMYTCYVFLPLGIASSTFRIVAMIVALPAARLILKDRITVLKIIGVVVGSIGLLMVCKT